MPTVNINNNNDNTRLKVEGESRLTPFEALYLLELACMLRVGTPDGKMEKHITHSARVSFLNDLIEQERLHPEWHFNDFELWVRRNVEHI